MSIVGWRARAEALRHSVGFAFLCSGRIVRQIEVGPGPETTCLLVFLGLRAYGGRLELWQAVS